MQQACDKDKVPDRTPFSECVLSVICQIFTYATEAVQTVQCYLTTVKIVADKLQKPLQKVESTSTHVLNGCSNFF